MPSKKLWFVIAEFLVLIASFYFYFLAPNPTLAPSPTPAESQAVIVPNCLCLHAGNTYTDVKYDPKFVTTDPEDKSFTDIALYRRSDLRNGRFSGDVLFVINVKEDFPFDASNTVNAILEPSPDNMPGPKFNQRATIAGLSAALATPDAGDDYYMVPFGNRVIHIDYIHENFTPDERKLAGRALVSAYAPGASPPSPDAINGEKVALRARLM